MSLMETLMDEFQDETEFKKLNEREVTAWLEVGIANSYFVLDLVSVGWHRETEICEVLHISSVRLIYL